jgi:IS30 family transposase
MKIVVDYYDSIFPKGMPLDKVSIVGVAAALEAMNHCPRKCLVFRTPREVFAKLT